MCGLRGAQDVAAATQAGARYLGFVVFPKSPRHVEIAQARNLAIEVPPGVAKVALVVNATDAALDAICAAVPLDMVQLHGSESPARVAEIRPRLGLPAMKAGGVAETGDPSKIAEHEAVADQILVDAKAPKGAALPGGNGLAFDWRLIAGRE